MNLSKWSRILPTYTCVLCGLSVLASCGIRPWEPFLEHVPNGDKVIHLVSAGFLSFAVLKALGPSFTARSRFGLGLLMTGLLAGVTLEETSQLLVVDREFSAFDLLFNYLGILGGWTLALLIPARVPTR